LIMCFIVFISFFFFFFFQAEDGIRDRTVTGVQTCALPISWRVPELRLTTCDAAPAPARLRSRGPAWSRRPRAPRRPASRSARREIGRASCRERVEIPVVGVAVKTKKTQARLNIVLAAPTHR